MEYYDIQIDTTVMGERIQKERKYKDMTQEQLAEAIGVSGNFIKCVEAGRKGMSMKTFFRLCKCLGVSPDYLLMEKSDDPEEMVIKARLKESILAPLNECNVKELQCAENLLRSYVDGVKESRMDEREKIGKE